MVVQPQDPSALKVKGNELLNANDPSGALDCYASALAILGPKPSKAADDARAALRLALNLNASLACLRLERWEQAEEHASSALRVDPLCAKAHYRRGLARSSLPGLAADARRDLNQALSLAPSAEVRQALVQLEAREREEAGFVPPVGASGATAYDEEAALRRRLGQARVSWGDWQAAERFRTAQAAQSRAWRFRASQASKAVQRPALVEPAAASLGEVLEKLAELGAMQGDTREEPSTAASAASPASPRPLPEGVLFAAAGPWFFDGQSSTDLPFDVACNPIGTFSVELWAVCHGGLGSQAVLTSRDVGGCNGRAGYVFYLEPDFRWSFWLGVGCRWEKLLGPRAEIGTWTHLRAVVVAGAGGEARFYVDRALVQCARDIDFVPNKQRPLRLGAGQTEGRPRFFFRGDVRDIVVYSRDVGDEELQPCRQPREPARPGEEACELLVQPGEGALAARWCGAVLPAAHTASAVEAHETFRAVLLDFLEMGAAESGDAVHGLFLAVDLQARARFAKRGEEIELAYDSGGGAARSRLFKAIVLQCGGLYRLLYEVENVCSLADALRRQRLLRPSTQGWLTAKDLYLWLAALEALTFSTNKDEVERAVNTVFLFGYWAESEFISPDARLTDFQAHARHGLPRARAAIVERMPHERLKGAMHELAAAVLVRQVGL